MPNEQYLQSFAALILRVALGLMFFTHAIVLKVMTFGMAGTTQFFVSLGFPAWVATATVVAEAIGGILLLAGVQVRWVALALSPILLGAVWVHSGNGWIFDAPHGGWEYPLYLFVLCIAQAMLGEGAFALSRSTAR